MCPRVYLLGMAVAASLFVGGQASACFYTTPVRVGDGRPPSERQLAAERRLARRGAAEAALASGADVKLELANLLVPNIRPVLIQRSDCGPNEIDLAEGEETIEDWLAGTYLAGHGQYFMAAQRAHDRDTLGPTCNAEFRARFASYLGRRLDARQLRADYIFLAEHWDGSDREVRRLVAFEGNTRRPPLRWLDPEVARWASHDRRGRALQQVMDGFWRESAPLLDDSSLACPAAVAAWPAVRASIIAEIEARHPYVRAWRR